MSEPRPGRYRHYKGRHYVVLGTARHSETEEELVVYRQDYGERSLWVRPKAMFLESVERDGRLIPRFERCGDASDACGDAATAPPNQPRNDGGSS
jgi:hypothetical protein